MTTLQQKSMSSAERPRWRVVLLVLLPMMLCVSSSTAQDTPRHTPEEEKEMDAKMRAEIEAKNKRMRERNRQRKLEEQREAEKRRAEREANKYKVDPVLAEIIRERLSDTRDRDRVERNLLEYIKNNPDSAFMPELYFHLGAIYSHNTLVPKEKMNRKKAKMYFEKAHELYDGKYSAASDCAWAYLVMKRRVPVAKKREYYDWVRKMEKLQPEDVWPYRNIQKCMIYGSPPEWSQAERAEQAKGFHQNSGVYIAACERTLMMYADLPTLNVYAAEYPETELGKQAQMKLQGRADAIDRMLMEEIDTSLTALANGELATVMAPNLTDEQNDPAVQNQPSANTVSASLEDKDGRGYLWVLLPIAAVIAIVISWLFWRRSLAPAT